jgi:hypothetical protein
MMAMIALTMETILPPLRVDLVQSLVQFRSGANVEALATPDLPLAPRARPARCRTTITTSAFK